eukprot:jgi/Botrbrau1/12393/Bobra.0084s0016.1
MPARSWYSADYRARASTLYEECNFNAAMAGAKLGVDRHGRAPKRPGQFCMRQYQKEQHQGSVENQPIPGRPSKVPTKLVNALVAKLVLPPDSEGEPVYVDSVEHALQQHPTLKRKFNQLEVHPATIQRAVAKGMAAAGIAFRSVKRQRRLTPDQKKARRNFLRY